MSLPEEEHVDNKLQRIIALTEQTSGVQRSVLDRWFWMLVLIGLLAIPLINLGLFWGVALLKGERPGISGGSSIIISDIAAMSTTELCPGDALKYAYTIEVLKPGIYASDESIWRILPPPQTVVYSEAQRFVAAEPVSYLVERSWAIPELYLNPVDNKLVPWLPGNYERQIVISAVGRDTVPSMQRLAFSIKEQCP